MSRRLPARPWPANGPMPDANAQDTRNSRLVGIDRFGIRRGDLTGALRRFCFSALVLISHRALDGPSGTSRGIPTRLRPPASPLACVPEVGAARHGSAPHLGLKHPQPLGDVLDVKVHADLGAVAVLGLEERALADHDLGFAHVLAHQMRARLGIAEVGQDRDVEGACDLHAAFFQFSQLFLREVGELGTGPSLSYTE